MNADWSFPEFFPVLTDNEVHLWLVDLTTERELMLSPDEQERADRFKIDKPRQQFSLARTALRQLLSRYLNLEASDITFEFAEHGKPSIKNPDSELQFNVSHSQNYALIGFAAKSPIGVDIEWLGRRADVESLTKRFFSESEQTALAATPGDARNHAFMDCWVQKEAYLKSLGTGLSRDTRTFSVSPTGGLIDDEHDSKAPERLKIKLLTPVEEYTAAVSTTNRISKHQLIRIN